MLEHDHNGTGTGYADGALVPTTAPGTNDHSGEEFLTALAFRHGIRMETLLEVIADYDEHNTQQGTAFSSDLIEFHHLLKKAMGALCQYRGDQKQAVYCVAYILQMHDLIGANSLIELGERLTELSAQPQGDMELLLSRGVKAVKDGVETGGIWVTENPALLAWVEEVSQLLSAPGEYNKQRINKCIQHFRDMTELPLLATQRKPEAREKMRLARLGQLG